MNVFALLIAAIAAGALLYMAGGLLAPFLEPRADLSQAANIILEEAQADLGHNAVLFLTVQPGQSLYARNFDKPTRSVKFSCASIHCCPFLEGCTQPYTSTPERMLIHQKSEVTLTARCLMNDVPLHTCTLYLGEEPAQVVWEKTTPPSNTVLEPGKPLVFAGKIRNVGESNSSTLTARVQIMGTTFVSGKETPTLLVEQEQLVEGGLAPNETADISLEVLVLTPGNYTALLSVEGEDAGKDVKEYSLILTGEIISTCQPITSGTLDVTYDAFNDVCKIKRFCTGCGFAFECRDAWEQVSPAQSPAYHESAEPGFTYLIAPKELGAC